MLFREIFFFRTVLFKDAPKTQKLRIFWSKMSQNVIFCVQIFFKTVLFKKTFFLKIMLFKKLFFLQNRAFQN